MASLPTVQPTGVADPFTTMVGLRAKWISRLVWPQLQQGVWLALFIHDVQAKAATLLWRRHGTVAGESKGATARLSSDQVVF